MSESGWSYALVNLAASGTLVSGVAGKKIRVLNAILDANNGESTWKFESSTGPTRLVGNLYFSDAGDAPGALVLPYSPVGWFETAEGDDLLLTMVSGVAGIGGSIVYELV
jgi:hypothetical protein